VPLAVKLIDSLTIGELIVGVGTALLAVFTWRLARATFVIDRRTVRREVVGAARMILGELVLADLSLKHAAENKEWHPYMSLPHQAWDRHGPIVVRALPSDAAFSLMQTYETWRLLETKIQEIRIRRELGPADALRLDDDDDHMEFIQDQIKLNREAQPVLIALARDD
jgi:hypothetical protein